MSRRLSVTLEQADEDVLAEVASRHSGERSAIERWASQNGMDLAESASEAALVRILMRIGAKAIKHDLLDLAYADLAIELAGGDHGEGRDETREARRRYLDRAGQPA